MRFLPAVVLFAASLSAQQSHLEQITVNAVEMPVYVSRNGVAVDGLTREDFELYVNGQPHPIDYVDVVREADANLPQNAASRDLSRRRLVVLLFDTMNSSSIAIHRAKEAAQKYIADAPASDTFAVATAGGNGIRFSVSFTNDRVAVQRAIATLRPSIAGDTFNLATLRSERSGLRSSMEGGIGATQASGEWGDGVQPPIVIRSRSSELAAALAEKYDDMERQGLRVVEEKGIDQLAALADRLAPLQGIKHVVLLRESRLPADGEPFSVISRMHERFRAAGVILDAIDLGGLRAPMDMPSSPLRTPLEDVAGSLYTLALDTGGTVIANRTDVNLALRALRQLQGITYVVGFTPPAGQKVNNSVRIKVRDQRPFTSVQYRRTYSAAPRDAAGEGLFLADVISNDIPQGGMNVDVDVQPGREGVLVSASVPGVEILSHATDGKTLLDVFLYVFDEKSVVAGWSHARLLVDTEKGREFLSSNPYSIRKGFALEPGRYAAKALVRVVGRDVTGFQREDFVTEAP